MELCHSIYTVIIRLVWECYNSVSALSTYNAKSVADPGFDLKGGGVEEI